MTTPTTDIYRSINTLARHFKSVFKTGDTAAIAEFYSEEGMLLPTGSDFIRGRKDIGMYWQGAFDMGIKNINLDILEIEQHGNTAIEMSHYTLTDENDQVIDHGKGIVIWKLEAGNWKMHRDIWNTNMD
jgi:ketosteroid isomerase-like protein